MSHNLSDRLHRKISNHILLKNYQLRRFSRLVLDIDFIRFAETVEESECHLDDLLNHLEPVATGRFFIVSLGRKISNLCRARDICLKQLQAFERLSLQCKEVVLGKIFHQRLERTTKALRGSFEVFLHETEDLLQQLPDIYDIFQLQNHLRQTTFLHLIVSKNHKNLQHIVHPGSLRSHSLRSIVSLRLQTHTLLADLLVRHLQLLDEMDSTTSVELIRDRLNQEITKSRTEMVIQEAELTELRQELFPTSEVSLKQQRDVAIDQLEVKEIDLERQIRSIDLLQTNIQDLEQQVAHLVEERQRAHDELMAKREGLRTGIREIVRLERLIEKIEREISDRMFEFQERLEQLERKRLAILEDDTLTEEERARLLAELEQEVQVIREKHDADQKLLKDKREELKELSKSVTEDLDAFKDELVRKHLDEIRELEERKKDATPSELELIIARIAALEQEFEENMAMLEKAQARPKYYTDDRGRYYINEAGQKVYQRESGGSEYILTADGMWEKIKDAVENQTDEKGEFYVDQFGRKIYTKKYFQDEFGKYYIDSNGRRIYLEASEKSESVIVEDFEEVTPHESSIFVSSTEESEGALSQESETKISDTIKQQRASDFKYIQDTVGLPLKKGLALTFLHQPEDPIEFLAKFLEKYHKDQKNEAARVQLLEEVKQKKESLKAEEAAMEAETDDC